MGFNWIGLIGAGAWLPWIYILFKFFVKPDIKIINFRRILTIYNNTNGPYISIPLSIVSTRRSSTIKSIILTLIFKDTNQEKSFECYASADETRRSIALKDLYWEQVEISPLGILVLEKDKPVTRNFSFNDKNNVDYFDKKIFAILNRVYLEKQKNTLFVANEDFLKQLDEIVELRDKFKNVSSWQSGKYIIELDIYIYERKKPYKYVFEGELEQFKVENLLSDCESFNKWIISSDFIEIKNPPVFKFANVSINPVD